MLYREIIAVCSQIHAEYKYTAWAEKQLLGVQEWTTHETLQGLRNISIIQRVTHHKLWSLLSNWSPNFCHQSKYTFIQNKKLTTAHTAQTLG